MAKGPTERCARPTLPNYNTPPTGSEMDSRAREV